MDVVKRTEITAADVARVLRRSKEGALGVLAKILAWWKKDYVALKIDTSEMHRQERPELTGFVKCLYCGEEYSILKYLPRSSTQSTLVCAECREAMELYPHPRYGWGLPIVVSRERPT